MLHALLYDRAMQFDKTWDSYEAPVVLGVWRNVVNCHFEVESLCMGLWYSRTLERVSVGSCKKFCWMMKSSSEPLMHVDSRRLGCSSHPIILFAKFRTVFFHCPHLHWPNWTVANLSSGSSSGTTRAFVTWTSKSTEKQM